MSLHCMCLVYSKLGLLLFADDLVLLSESIQNLQSAVDVLSEYSVTWDLNINLIKTKLNPGLKEIQRVLNETGFSNVFGSQHNRVTQ